MGTSVQTRGSILVVDDEPTVTEVVSRYLERAGFAASAAEDGSAALEMIAAEPPDLVVLDVAMPGMDGLEVMRRLRGSSPRRTAVILLTARGEESDRVMGLRLGADDYVTKPFSPAELIARIDAVLRRMEVPPDHAEPLLFGRLRIDPGARIAFVDDADAQLTQREFDLLLYLARNAGRTFSRGELMDAVWRYAFYTDTSTVTVHVRRLRAKIETDAAKPEHIQTVWGAGYRFSP